MRERERRFRFSYQDNREKRRREKFKWWEQSKMSCMSLCDHQLFETHKEEEEKKEKWHEVTKVTISMVVVCEIMWIITKNVEKKERRDKIALMVHFSLCTLDWSLFLKERILFLTEMTDQEVKTTGRQYKRIFNYGLSMFHCWCCCCVVCVMLLDMKMLGRQIDDEDIEEEDDLFLSKWLSIWSWLLCYVEHDIPRENTRCLEVVAVIVELW